MPDQEFFTIPFDEQEAFRTCDSAMFLIQHHMAASTSIEFSRHLENKIKGLVHQVTARRERLVQQKRSAAAQKTVDIS